MTLRQLEYLVATVDAGSISRAALELHVAQPSLSVQLQALEAELGGRLLERSARGVRPTAAGEAMLPAARAAVAAAGRSARAARAALGLQAGEVELATVGSVALGLLPQAIRRWQAEQPDRTVRLSELRDGPALVQAILDGAAELGIGPRPLDWPGELRSLGWEEFVVVFPPGDRALRRARSVALERLAGRRWVLFERGHALAALTEDLCRAEGFEPQAAVRTAQIAAAPVLAAAGLGPALVPRNIVSAELSELARPLYPPRARELCAFARDRFSPLVSAFLDVLEREPWPPRPRGAQAVGAV
jgi:DNA-binding transcriptional LysR family regulator